MLVVHCDGSLDDRQVRDLPLLLAGGDLLVLNDTRVIAAQLQGERRRGDNTIPVSATLIEHIGGRQWWVLCKPGRRVRKGDRLVFVANDGTEGLRAHVLDKEESGRIRVDLGIDPGALDPVLSAIGRAPLPPYIAARRLADTRDDTDYQTVFAASAGAVAAPTAGLHFTPDLLGTITERGVDIAKVTLHVGPGTFLPVKVSDTRNHTMHAEKGLVTAEMARRLNRVRAAGGRILAVGTTTLRLLESAVDERGEFRAFSGSTDIFITPGYPIRSADMLLTNFHLPRSTLFMLVSAFSGLANMKEAYAHAICEGYRFYSYGDACLLMRNKAQ